MKKRMKNKLDEMQEQKMLKIERNGCWFAFWGLVVTLFIQVIIYGYEADSWRYMVGEWIVFMCLSLYISIDCLRNGIWDRRLSPTPIVNACTGLIAGIVVGILNFVLTYRRHHRLLGSVAAGIFLGVMTFVLCFAALTFGTSIYKKRVKHLEQEDAEEELDTHVK